MCIKVLCMFIYAAYQYETAAELEVVGEPKQKNDLPCLKFTKPSILLKIYSTQLPANRFRGFETGAKC